MSDRDLSAAIGACIRNRRRALGWSQASLAEKLDLSIDHVSLVERGARMLSLPALVRVADVLSVSADELLGRRSPGDAWIGEATAMAHGIHSPQSRRVALAALRALVAFESEGQR